MYKAFVIFYQTLVREVGIIYLYGVVKHRSILKYIFKKSEHCLIKIS